MCKEAPEWSEGRLVNTNTRNARVVACLILAMTAGARVLLWLEPTPTVSGQFRLTAEGGPPVEEVTIEYAQPGELPFPEAACLIWPDGRREGDQLGPRVRLVVVGSDGPLPDEQKQSLLTALGSLAWRGGGLTATTPSIQLDSGFDSRVTAQARELCEMLVAKRFID
jgi:hypothetical protein